MSRIVSRLVRTPIGRRALTAAAMQDPTTALAAAGFVVERSASFRSVPRLPASIEGFEDCAFVLSSNSANHGLAQLTLEEAAHLYRLVSHSAGPHVEIGRYKGGGTLVMAAALDERSTLFSVDTHEKGGASLDEELVEVLRHLGLEHKVELLVGDSHTLPIPAEQFGVVFLDGDPTYRGTLADVERWGSRLADGGHLVLHDATLGAPRFAAIGPLVTELSADPGWRREPDTGTMVEFRRVQVEKGS